MKWLRKLLRKWVGYDEELDALHSQLAGLRRLVKERTEVSFDIAHSEGDVSCAIMVGRYRDRDFVQTFNLNHADFKNVVDWTRDLQRSARVRRVDAPPVFKSVFERERF